MAPELFTENGVFSFASDIWALGCILYELCSLRPPFMARDMRGLSQKVIAGVYPAIPTKYSEDLSNVIKMCLEVTPSKRPTASQLLRKREVVLRLK